ncbi:MAG TPA: response regulator [Cyclobacteriaceae bacterium]
MGKTILVVEDFASVRKFVRASLERNGYTTFGACNGNDGYKLLLEKADEINLVLTDYHMPEVTGYDLLKKIKGNDVTKNIPVIFLTTEADAEKIEAAKEADLFAWIKKPYRAEAFFSQIASAFHHH